MSGQQPAFRHMLAGYKPTLGSGLRFRGQEHKPYRDRGIILHRWHHGGCTAGIAKQFKTHGITSGFHKDLSCPDNVW